MTNERANVQVLDMVNCWVSSFTERGNINKQRSRYTRENNEFPSRQHKFKVSIRTGRPSSTNQNFRD